MEPMMSCYMVSIVSFSRLQHSIVNHDCHDYLWSEDSYNICQFCVTFQDMTNNFVVTWLPGCLAWFDCHISVTLYPAIICMGLHASVDQLKLSAAAACLGMILFSAEKRFRICWKNSFTDFRLYRLQTSDCQFITWFNNVIDPKILCFLGLTRD